MSRKGLIISTPHRGRTPIRTRARALAVGAGVLLVGALAGVGPTTAASAAIVVITCPSTVTSITWDGSSNDTPGKVGDNRNWADAYNWSADCTPGTRDGSHSVDVTIPSGANVFINDGESAQVGEMHSSASLTITPGGTLELFGPSQSKTMTLEGLLTGVGQLTVTSTMKWISTPNGGSTQETRWCPTIEPCTSPAPVAGVTVIAPGATLLISGRGVNLDDQRVIENHGTTKLSGQGYIAANYGTEFHNLWGPGAAAPKFLITNDLGYFQGIATPGFTLGTFVNSGTVSKTAGTGVSIIDADFTNTDSASMHMGTVAVHSGTLSLFTPNGSSTMRTAQVQQGTTFGNGAPDGCNQVTDPGSCSVIQPTTSDPQVTSVQLTKTGSITSKVTIQDRPDLAVTGERGVPVQIDTPGAQSDPAHPLRFRILLDASTLNPGETAAGVAATAPVSRQPNTSAPYAVLPNCGPSQDPTTAVPVCVARTQSVTETNNLGTGDVVLVISSLENSRYRIG